MNMTSVIIEPVVLSWVFAPGISGRYPARITSIRGDFFGAQM
jgi:hypothetical protein